MRIVEADSALAGHLEARAGTFVLIRPDAYRAASIDDATAEKIEAALSAALALHDLSLRPQTR